ncbi:MAG: 50S ribosomal protein L24 [Microthrixaceae bacterium]|jgi:large subunit ribosomal protein L24
MKIRKGDRVVVLAGKDKGKEGTVTRAIPKADKVVVEGVNVAQRHRKPTKAMEQGGIIQIEMPIHVSNVALIDPDGKPTRVGYRVESDGTKTRVSRRTGAELS